MEADPALDHSGCNGAERTDTLVVSEVANRVNNADSRGDGQVSLRFLHFSCMFVSRPCCLNSSSRSFVLRGFNTNSFTAKDAVPSAYDGASSAKKYVSLRACVGPLASERSGFLLGRAAPLDRLAL